MSDLPDALPDVRAALLAAARAELAEHGHAGISLRAVARRAGVSHAAPKYYFSDRAALLTSVAAQGFAQLAGCLRQVPPTLAALGQAYITFAMSYPALFDLMFRPSELRTEDPELRHAQRDAIGLLDAAIAATQAAREDPGTAARDLTVISWALAHGLAVLTLNGALQTAGHGEQPGSAEVAHHLVEVFTRRLTETLQALTSGTAHLRYCSMAGAARAAISSGLALTSGSSRITWRWVAMPIRCAATRDARS
jgi:AcrR family transcriptional regulator